MYILNHINLVISAKVCELFKMARKIIPIFTLQNQTKQSVYGKDDKYKVLKVIIMLKNSKVHTTNLMITSKRNVILEMTIKTFFFQLMNDKNSTESILL